MTRRPRLVAAAFVLFASAGCAHGTRVFPQHPKVAHTRSDLGDWRLDTYRNGFADALVCRLHNRKTAGFYVGQAAAFAFDKDWDVHDAVYRIDSGPPRAVRGDLPELVRQGTPIDQGAVANASAGLVWIPLSLLEEATNVSIQARSDRRARVFRLRGLAALHRIAVERGCSPDSRFVR